MLTDLTEVEKYNHDRNYTTWMTDWSIRTIAVWLKSGNLRCIEEQVCYIVSRSITSEYTLVLRPFSMGALGQQFQLHYIRDCLTTAMYRIMPVSTPITREVAAAALAERAAKSAQRTSPWWDPGW